MKNTEQIFYYTETFNFDPSFNLAFEEYILTNKKEGNWLILWQNANTVVVGRNQNTAEEINAAFVKERGITVVRRTTGGGAVYHDLGNLNYSFICDAGDTQMLDMTRFTSAVCVALHELGVTAQADGRNDITVEGKKVSGTAQRLHDGRILHHGTLLFNSNLDTVAAALNTDPSKFDSKSTKSVRSRVGNICDFMPSAMTIDCFKSKLLVALTRNGMIETRLDTEEVLQVNSLADTKYRKWDWTYGASPAFNYRRKKRFDGGTADIRAEVSNGRIESIRIYGDFMARRPLNELETALIGCEFRYAAVSDIIAGFELQDLLGGIIKEELLELMFE
jgi:lipoate-protein ligase A